MRRPRRRAAMLTAGLGAAALVATGGLVPAAGADAVVAGSAPRVGAAAASAAPSTSAAAYALPAKKKNKKNKKKNTKPVTLQLLSFNDFHGHLAPPTGSDGRLLGRCRRPILRRGGLPRLHAAELCEDRKPTPSPSRPAT